MGAPLAEGDLCIISVRWGTSVSIGTSVGVLEMLVLVVLYAVLLVTKVCRAEWKVLSDRLHSCKKGRSVITFFLKKLVILVAVFCGEDSAVYAHPDCERGRELFLTCCHSSLQSFLSAGSSLTI